MTPMVDKHWNLRRNGYIVLVIRLAWAWGIIAELDLHGASYFYLSVEFFGSRAAFCWWGK